MKIDFGHKIGLIGYEREFRCGDVVKHFKRETLKETDDQMMFLYQIIGMGTDVSSKHDNIYIPVIIYKALYGNEDLFVRDVRDFFEHVDKEKYPNITQEYKFEVI